MVAVTSRMVEIRVGVEALETRTRVVERLVVAGDDVRVLFIRTGESAVTDGNKANTRSSVPLAISERLITVGAGRLIRTIVWSFVRNGDVMRMAFPNTGSSHSDKLSVFAQVFYGRRTTVTHACT